MLIEQLEDDLLEAEVKVIEGGRQEFEVEFESVRSPMSKLLDALIQYILISYILGGLFADVVAKESRLFNAGLHKLFLQCYDYILTRESFIT